MRVAWLLCVLAACASTAEAPTVSGSAAGETTTASTAAPGVTAPVSDEPSPSTTDAAAPTGVTPEGFEMRAAAVTKGDGTTCDLCLWVAETADQRSRGLMFVTDLGDADGMAFVYPQPRTGTFWMKNTPMPLSIAFFSPDGAYMRAFDMEPCGSGSCPSYTTPTDFLVAVEAPRGELEALGLTDGSTLTLLDTPCENA